MNVTAIGLALLAASTAMPVATVHAAQVADTVPADTYHDPGARTLIARAIEARGREEGEVESYEGSLHERVYVGLDGLRFRRERSLYQSERTARIRWDRSGRTIQWLGATDAAPMIGERAQVSWGRDPGGEDDGGGHINVGLGSGDDEIPGEQQRQIQQMLADNLSPLIFTYRPGDDRIAFGNRFALHPLADTAAFHYRYRSGDTLSVDLPGDVPDVTLIEIQVEPRRPAFELLAGSLWFDALTGDLARAHYRPSRPFDLAVDEGGDVPGFLSPVRVDIEFLTVEYSLQELRWWLPRRFGVRGEMRAGRLVRAPVAVEWSVRDYLVNTDSTRVPGPEETPSGWATASGVWEDQGGRTEDVRVLVPPLDSLRSSPTLTGELLGPSPIAFSDAEIEDLRSDLEALLPARSLFGSGLAYGVADGNLRYNRVEGVSGGVSTELGMGTRDVLLPRIRFGVLDQQVRGALTFRRGGENDHLEVTGFRRLGHTDDFGDPLSLGSSLSNLIFRNGHTQFHDARGFEFALRKGSGRIRTSLRAYRESHRAVSRQTNFYLWEPLTDDTLPSVRSADAGSIHGLAGDLRWQWGDDPGRGLASGALRGEVAGGDFRYRRALATLAASRPVLQGLAAAVELGAGTTWGSPPVQKQFYLGGAHTLRGYAGSHVSGASFWMARGELATALPLVRLSAFSDLGWAGPPDRWSEGKALWSAGAGVSLLDGLVRLDAAWPLRGASGGRFYLYLDGLF